MKPTLLIYFLGDIEAISGKHPEFFAPVRIREGMSGQIAQFYSHRVEDAFANQETVEIRSGRHGGQRS